MFLSQRPACAPWSFWRRLQPWSQSSILLLFTAPKEWYSRIIKIGVYLESIMANEHNVRITVNPNPSRELVESIRKAAEEHSKGGQVARMVKRLLAIRS